MKESYTPFGGSTFSQPRSGKHLFLLLRILRIRQNLSHFNFDLKQFNFTLTHFNSYLTRFNFFLTHFDFDLTQFNFA